ncbi:hypothetical protein ACNKHW_01255 [Shigella flexneri]
MKPNAGPLRLANSGTALTMRMPNHMFLDPVKVTILTPGVDDRAMWARRGSRRRWWRNPRRTWDSGRENRPL